MIKFIKVEKDLVYPLYSRYDIVILGHDDKAMGVIISDEGRPIPMDTIERIKKEVQDGRINI